MVDQCEDLLNKAKRYHPQQLIDGQQNVWILKPGGKSRGRGEYSEKNYCLLASK